MYFINCTFYLKHVLFVYNIRNIKNKKGFNNYNFIYNRIFTHILFIYNISRVPIYQYLEFPDIRLWFKYNPGLTDGLIVGRNVTLTLTISSVPSK
jgi:hypothetical protein